MAKRPTRRPASRRTPPPPAPPALLTPTAPPVVPSAAALAAPGRRPARRTIELLPGGPVDLVHPTPDQIDAAHAEPEKPPTDEEQAAQDDETRKRDLLAAGLDRFKVAASAFSEQRARELDDLNFELDQWPEEYRKERAGGTNPAGRVVPARPCLEINKLDQPIQQVLNEARQSRLGIQIKPRGAGASLENAHVRQGIIRMIEVDSRAHLARHWALDRAAKCGLGCYIIRKKFANDGDNDLDLVVERVLNQHSVYLDPFAKEPDWSDGEWAFITTDIPEGEYKRRWPDSNMARVDAQALQAIGDSAPGWISQTEKEGKAYRVAEHYYVVHKDRTRVFLNGQGEVAGWQWQDELTEEQQALIEPNVERVVATRTVKWCMMNANEILDEEDWEGRYIPIIPVIGKEYNVNGKRVWKGIISNAKDAQRSYNVMRSRQLEAIGLASLSTWVMAEGQDEGYEDMWDRANTSAFTRLLYKPTTFEGHLTMPPHRDTAEPAIMAITQGVREADGDIKATTGRFDPSLGRSASADQSGKAIRELKIQGETGTSNYLDNLASISITHEGRVLNDMLEHVYDREGRIVRIVGDEDEEYDAMVGVPYTEKKQGDARIPVPLQGGMQAFDPQNKKHKFYNLKDGGQYRVVVTVGPSAPSQQEADKAFMNDVAQAAPTLVPIFADLWVRTSGSKLASQIADRIKAQSPFAKGDDNQDEEEIPAEAKQAMQAMQAKLKEAGAIIQKLQQEIAVDAAKAKVTLITKSAELKSRERIAEMEMRKDLALKRADIEQEHRGQILDAALSGMAATRDQDFERQLTHEMTLLDAILTPPAATAGAEA